MRARKGRDEAEAPGSTLHRAPRPGHGAADRGPMTPARAGSLQGSAGNDVVGRMVAAAPKVPFAARTKRTQDEVVERGDSPPTNQQKTEEGKATRSTRSGKAGATPSVKGKEKAVEEEIGNPTLAFNSGYEGDRTQSLNGAASIGFAQTATLTRAPGMSTATADAYDFWQEVTDENYQITPDSTNYRPKKSKRNWVVDGPFRPPYNDEGGNIANTADHITFNDHPGFSGGMRMTAGYFLTSYEVRFRWKVRKKQGGRFTKGEPFWESDEMVHRVTVEFDSEDPEKAAVVNATPAGNRTWNVQLPD
ncbi:hypothetical protein ABT160_17975 [Streptomyces sp. NPDC001941]|uniref:hypothetical protein n=1 Tax=Streptomyces sp. NPDC001941 TaxID=3154659 RepID=UPI003319F0A9